MAEPITQIVVWIPTTLKTHLDHLTTNDPALTLTGLVNAAIDLGIGPNPLNTNLTDSITADARTRGRRTRRPTTGRPYQPPVPKDA